MRRDQRNELFIRRKALRFSALRVLDADMHAVDAHRTAFNGRLPGKGELILEAIKIDRRFSILAWEYQALLRFDPS